MAMKLPITLKDLLLADLRRAQNLITKVHPDPIEPQFRIATPEGDYWIAITLTENTTERSRRLSLRQGFLRIHASVRDDSTILATRPAPAQSHRHGRR